MRGEGEALTEWSSELLESIDILNIDLFPGAELWRCGSPIGQAALDTDHSKCCVS